MAISIHALREESDESQNAFINRAIDISIHALREESDYHHWQKTQHKNHFNPRSPRGERRHSLDRHSIDYEISIHALREESDNKAGIKVFFDSISIHALREESDHNCMKTQKETYIFQSTLSARRATAVAEASKYAAKDFNPRSPRGERHKLHALSYNKNIISIHALREESDPKIILLSYSNVNFNPRSPRGERLIC